MSGWLADFLRFIWGLLYWNARKSVFRWWGGHCPCQNPSDSGHAYETACDACASWQNPARFRRVCPLLVETPDGLRCSAETKDVRPFWGRAFGFYGGGLAALWLTGALTVFAVMRGIGYPVSIVSVAWPPAWQQIRAARAEYFFQKARRSLDAGHVSEALLALPYAYTLNPRNYSAGLLLAQLWQIGQPVLSDRLYAKLLHEHPEQRATIAAAWYRALLARGDFAKITQLARDVLASQPSPAPDWLRALFFAARRTGDPAPLRTLLDKQRALTPALRNLIEIEILIEEGRTADAHAALLRLNVDTPYAAYYQVNELARLGFPSEAISELNAKPGFFGAFDQAALRLDAFATQGWSSLVHNEAENLLLAPANASVFELLAAQLIRHPDAELLAESFDKLEREPPANRDDAYRAALALFFAAGANKDWDHLRAARGLLRKNNNGSIAILDVTEAFFRGKSAHQHIESLLPMLQPLSPEVMYALFEHYGKNQPAGPAP
ncbi:MAG: hypothetical protein KGJ37_00995 [Verrucomicrobiota bacterium]|nr:hypothetical protein [Verrucomicrobiota bacterium]